MQTARALPSPLFVVLLLLCLAAAACSLRHGGRARRGDTDPVDPKSQRPQPQQQQQHSHSQRPLSSSVPASPEPRPPADPASPQLPRSGGSTTTTSSNNRNSNDGANDAGDIAGAGGQPDDSLFSRLHQRIPGPFQAMLTLILARRFDGSFIIEQRDLELLLVEFADHAPDNSAEGIHDDVMKNMRSILLLLLPSLPSSSSSSNVPEWFQFLHARYTGAAPVRIPKWYHCTKADDTHAKRILNSGRILMSKDERTQITGAFVSTVPLTEYGPVCFVFDNSIDGNLPNYLSEFRGEMKFAIHEKDLTLGGGSFVYIIGDPDTYNELRTQRRPVVSMQIALAERLLLSLARLFSGDLDAVMGEHTIKYHKRPPTFMDCVKFVGKCAAEIFFDSDQGVRDDEPPGFGPGEGNAFYKRAKLAPAVKAARKRLAKQEKQDASADKKKEKKEKKDKGKKKEKEEQESPDAPPKPKGSGS